MSENQKKFGLLEQVVELARQLQKNLQKKVGKLQFQLEEKNC